MERSGRIFAILLVLGVVLQCAVATTYVVGDSSGWAVPSDSSTYSNWVSGKTFLVGDILTFNFTTNAHDVLQVTKESYEACTSTNNIGSVITTGPANINLNSTGEHYYICTVSGHCQSGQKLSLTVSASPTTSPSPAGAPTSQTTPPPPPSSSGSFVFANVFVSVLCIVMCFLV
ncbi:Phytocyanin domain [Dillenia turbinata]|uniref:Phytocyanin domain n=1 Tax=Dillenia turbinata TaxID=194707 RepID=A0AAN8YTV6_9MAGN